ncbi:alpha/beta hydrolase [Acidobacteria bacterium AB60]|nr:alpha/beta hydrolase [Acidobacteria bacterium AB60]
MAAGHNPRLAGARRPGRKNPLTPVRKLVWTLVVIVSVVIAIAVAFYERPVSFFNRLLYTQMALAGVHSHYVMVEGHRMHYYVAGPSDGPAVVLVHGLGGQAEDWRNLSPFLRALGYRVYLPDLFGFGRSDRPVDFSYSIPDQAASVFAFMDAMNLRQVDLGGWSMGGWIVQRMAADHPERIRKLMIFDSAGLYVQPAWNTALFTPTTSVELDQLDTLLMPQPPQVPAFIAHDILRIARNHAWVMHRALNSMLTGQDTTDALLPRLNMPVLLVWGQLDQIMPLAQGEKMHQLIPQSKLEVVPDCGHMAPVQCADRIGPQVQAFLKQ